MLTALFFLAAIVACVAAARWVLPAMDAAAPGKHRAPETADDLHERADAMIARLEEELRDAAERRSTRRVPRVPVLAGAGLRLDGADTELDRTPFDPTPNLAAANAYIARTFGPVAESSGAYALRKYGPDAPNVWAPAPSSEHVHWAPPGSSDVAPRDSGIDWNRVSDAHAADWGVPSSATFNDRGE